MLTEISIKDREALKKRAKSLSGKGLNGIDFILVKPLDNQNPPRAEIEIHFINNRAVNALFTAGTNSFLISGGHRIKAGPANNDLKVVDVKKVAGQRNLLTLEVRPIGDYSTYMLSINHAKIDPVFSDIDFKFRPACFNLCGLQAMSVPEPDPNPTIDYLAKDYDSFKHTMIAALAERVPGWKPSSEADLDQVLLELISAAADELSDYQDRVMNEAFFSRARKRVSLARHARLVDYHIHQGNQASTWLALKVKRKAQYQLPLQFEAWEGSPENKSVLFIPDKTKLVSNLLNEMSLYTWEGSVTGLQKGSTSADLLIEGGTNRDKASEVESLIRDGKITHLLIQEHLNPETGNIAGRDLNKRQILEFDPKNLSQATIHKKDPITGIWYVRVKWKNEDKLLQDYIFKKHFDNTEKDISLFHGNLVQVYHGTKVSLSFSSSEIIRTKRGAICELRDHPIAYRDNRTSPDRDGEIPPVSTLKVCVEIPGTGTSEWEEKPNLVHSDDSDNNGKHFVVETDENQHSIIRFGDGKNGKELPENATVRCAYQVGYGPDGNIGADKLRFHNDAEIESCWNPRAITNGREPESVDQILRRVPEAYKYRQSRAITLQDYSKRAQDFQIISNAAARYVWTGSWRAVQVAVDPKESLTMDLDTQDNLARHLTNVKIILDDIELQHSRFIPLKIEVVICIDQNYWPEDIQSILYQEFSEGYTPDGRQGFFHPDRWTFGQELQVSQIAGRIQTVNGIDHIKSIQMQRWNEVAPINSDRVTVKANEVILVRNDPDHMETGFIYFDIRGGRG